MTGLQFTGWNECLVPVGLGTVGREPLDNVWGSEAYFTLVQLYGILFDKLDVPEPITMTYIPDPSPSIRNGDQKW